jgi:hypothetical protein
VSFIDENPWTGLRSVLDSTVYWTFGDVIRVQDVPGKIDNRHWLIVSPAGSWGPWKTISLDNPEFGIITWPSMTGFVRVEE